LSLFDLTLKQGDKPLDIVTIQKNLLEKLINSHSSDLKQTLTEFIEIYKTIPENDLNFLSRLNKGKMIGLLQSGGYNESKVVYDLLRDPKLTEEHRKALLEYCFKSNDPDYQNKITFLTNILNDEELATQFFDNETMSSFSKKYLNPKFFWSIKSSFDEILTELNTQIQLQKIPGEPQTAESLKQALQAASKQNVEKSSLGTAPEILAKLAGESSSKSQPTQTKEATQESRAQNLSASLGKVFGKVFGLPPKPIVTPVKTPNENDKIKNKENVPAS
ncbi:MAG: hypothetical protein KKE11_05520, partial [Gammaproteobacteria bacterium]|nr:hypothetical protein [Gammaproteobacteria bacterium]